MQRVRVKIEGLRDPQTAVRIAVMGADAIGLVFAQSPRWVSPEQAHEICQALPPWVATVGVFVNDDAATINRVIERTGVQYVQLHGEEPPERVAQIARPCIKAFRVRDENWLDDVRSWHDACGSGNLAAILLDAYNPDVRGGTGERFNWRLVSDARAVGAMKGLDPIILAGGLDAGCVSGAIELVRPWAVDVASGVEKSPGIKDLKKVEAFLRASQEDRSGWNGFWG